MSAIHTLYRRIFKLWRQRRFRLFLDLLRPRSDQSLLDVGGNPAFWTANPQPVRQIDSLNVSAPNWSPDAAPGHHIRTLVGDGCQLPMPDKCYDIGFSNSVIEHVGDWPRQQAFAAEIRRVARALWVQTPAFGFPIEPHYMAPLVHYLPRGVQKKILRWLTPWGWLARPDQRYVDFMVGTTRLLRKSEMRRLFPDCRIVTERVLWIFPKSYIAVRPA